MRQCIICLVLLCAIVFVCHAKNEEPTRWALLVGIDRYADSTITPLTGAVNDVKALQKVLVKYAGFSSERVFCLTSDDKASLPSLGNIITKLDYIASEMKPGDVFVFFFSGHGISRGGKSYLLPYHADIRSPLLLAKTGLSTEEVLMDCLGKIKSGKVILILDSCRNDPQGGRGSEDNVMTDEFAKSIRLLSRAGGGDDVELRATIYACKAGERAYEYPGKDRGLFSVALEEALSGKADDGDGRVTLEEVDFYLSKRVPDLVRQEYGGAKVQTPWIEREGSGAGDWVFSRVPNRGTGVPEEKGTGLLFVKASVDGQPIKDARVFVDGQEVGKTKYTDAAIPTGNHTVKVTKSCYHDYEEMVTIVKNKKSTVDAVLKPNCGSLKVSSIPTDADVEVVDSSGTRWGNGITLFQLSKLPSGNYHLTVSMNRYHPKNRDIVITDGEKTVESFILDPKFGTLKVDSIPQGATVFLAGSEKGTTPLEIEVDETTHSLKLSKEFYLDWSGQVEIRAGEQTYISQQLDEDFGKLKVEVEPGGSQILVDGKDKGLTPTTLRLPPASYRVEVRYDGYISQIHKPLLIVRGEVKTLNQPLVREMGTLQVLSTPAEARIIIDDQDYGLTPNIIRLPTGSYKLRLSKKCFSDYAETVDVVKDSKSMVDAVLEPTFGSLEVNSTPADADVEVVDLSGTRWSNLSKLPCGHYRLTVSKSRYHTKTKDIVIADGEKTVELFTLDQGFGTLKVESIPRLATVFLAGSEKGRTPLEIEVDSGSYLLVLREDEYLDWSKEVEIRDGELTSISGQLTADFWDLRLEVEPEGSQILVDGKNRGETPTTLRLSPTSHRVEVRSDGYVSQVHESLLISRGEVKILNQPLERESNEFPSDHEETIDIVQDEPVEVNIELSPAPPPAINSKPPKGMALIPAGEFRMGSNNGNDDEKPVHTVYLDAFYMDKCEVTNAQYKQFIDANPQWQKDGIDKKRHDGNYLMDWNNNHSTRPANRPVVYVSQQAASAYAKWVDKRLPTEAEWEKAARGGLSGEKYPCGDRISHAYANYSGIGGNDSWSGTSPVGHFAPNGYGLFDMAGNVSEWCADWYDKDYYSNSPERNPTGPKTGSWFRVAARGLTLATSCGAPDVLHSTIFHRPRTTMWDFAVSSKSLLTFYDLNIIIHCRRRTDENLCYFCSANLPLHFLFCWFMPGQF